MKLTYTDEILISERGVLLWGTIKPHELKSKGVYNETLDKVDNLITSIEIKSFYGSLSQNVSVKLALTFSNGKVSETSIYTDEFMRLMKESHVINNIFQGEYIVYFEGARHCIMNKASEDYKTMISNIKGAPERHKQKLETKRQERKDKREQDETLKRQMRDLDGYPIFKTTQHNIVTYYAYLGKHYYGYTNNTGRNFSKKGHLFLELNDNYPIDKTTYKMGRDGDTFAQVVNMAERIYCFDFICDLKGRLTNGTIGRFEEIQVQNMGVNKCTPMTELPLSEMYKAIEAVRSTMDAMSTYTKRYLRKKKKLFIQIYSISDSKELSKAVIESRMEKLITI